MTWIYPNIKIQKISNNRILNNLTQVLQQKNMDTLKIPVFFHSNSHGIDKFIMTVMFQEDYNGKDFLESQDEVYQESDSSAVW